MNTSSLRMSSTSEPKASFSRCFTSAITICAPGGIEVFRRSSQYRLSAMFNSKRALPRKPAFDFISFHCSSVRNAYGTPKAFLNFSFKATPDPIPLVISARARSRRFAISGTRGGGLGLFNFSFSLSHQLTRSGRQMEMQFTLDLPGPTVHRCPIWSGPWDESLS